MTLHQLQFRVLSVPFQSLRRLECTWLELQEARILLFFSQRCPLLLFITSCLLVYLPSYLR